MHIICLGKKGNETKMKVKETHGPLELTVQGIVGNMTLGYSPHSSDHNPVYTDSFNFACKLKGEMEFGTRTGLSRWGKGSLFVRAKTIKPVPKNLSLKRKGVE